MPAVQPIKLENASDATIRLLAAARADNALPPNMIQSMAQSPNVLEGYLQFSRALKGGKLDQEERAQIALAVARRTFASTRSRTIQRWLEGWACHTIIFWQAAKDAPLI